jgi:hypothetical protein
MAWDAFSAAPLMFFSGILVAGGFEPQQWTDGAGGAAAMHQPFSKGPFGSRPAYRHLHMAGPLFGQQRSKPRPEWQI